MQISPSGERLVLARLVSFVFNHAVTEITYPVLKTEKIPFAARLSMSNIRFFLLGPLPHKSVTERLSEHAQRHLQAREGGEVRKTPLGRTRSNVPPPKEVQHAVVSKSRSVDNVGGYQAPPVENLHRKLQRQLTLNPASDPR